MDNPRRLFLRVLLPSAVLAGAGIFSVPAIGFAQQNTNPPNRLPQNANPRPLPAAPLFKPPTMAQLRKNQREITRDVDQLFALAQQLKRQADKNDASQELSVALIEKTQEIEKLAKKIRDLARS